MLTVVHLVFTAGHTTSSPDRLIDDDVVARVLGLLALLELTDARRASRLDADGELVLLEDQDRSRWDPVEIEHGKAMLDRVLRLTGPGRPPGRFLLQAALAACHAEAGTWSDTDWEAVVVLYDRLLVACPCPVVALDRAVAVGYAKGPEAGLAALDPLSSEPALTGYHYLPTARADLLRRLGDRRAAAQQYRIALELAPAPAERRFLQARLDSLASG